MTSESENNSSPLSSTSATLTPESDNTSISPEMKNLRIDNNKKHSKNVQWFLDNYAELIKNNESKFGEYCIIVDESVHFLGTNRKDDAYEQISIHYRDKTNPYLVLFGEKELKTKQNAIKNIRNFEISSELSANFIWFLSNHKDILEKHHEHLNDFCIIFNQEIVFFEKDMNQAFEKAEANYSNDLYSKVLVIKLNYKKAFVNTFPNITENSSENVYDMNFKTPYSGAWLDENFLIDTGADLVTIFNHEKVKIDSNCIFGIGVSSSLSSDVLCILIHGLRCAITEMKYRKVTISVPLNIQIGHKLFFMLKANNLPIESHDADEFLTFLYNDSEMISWISNEFTSPSNSLQSKLNYFGIVSSQPQMINGLIGKNYLYFLKMLKDKNSDVFSLGE